MLAQNDPLAEVERNKRECAVRVRPSHCTAKAPADDIDVGHVPSDYTSRLAEHCYETHVVSMVSGLKTCNPCCGWHG
jgi:hypothetical protein